MSRIEEALRRARVPNHEQHVDTPVESAWHYDRLPSEDGGGAAAEVPPAVRPPAPVPPATGPVQGPPSPGPVQVPTAAVDSGASAKQSAPSRIRWTRSFSNAVAEKLVVMPETSQQSVEQYRKVAATLHQIQLERGVKVVMVASALPGEGKTLTSANLALTLSESYRRDTLLIDADLRRPALHNIFRVPNVSGLNDGLKAGDDARLSALRLTDKLTLLPGGKPVHDPMGGLTSSRMRRILEEAAARYEWVILDTAPLSGLADANVLGAMVDAAILVVRANQTPHQDVVNAIEALGRDRVLGCVLNDAEPMGDNAYHRYIVPAGSELQ